jgi:hypothetical protein
MAADFLVHRSDAELPTARGLYKSKMTKRGLLGSSNCDLCNCSRNNEILRVFYVN